MAHENELYVDAIDLIENRVSNDNQVPVIKNNKSNNYVSYFLNL